MQHSRVPAVEVMERYVSISSTYKLKNELDLLAKNVLEFNIQLQNERAHLLTNDLNKVSW